MTPKWACAECGYPFTRAWNARRHLDNKHGGTGNIVSFMEYLAGVNSGKYAAPSYAYFKPKPLGHSLVLPVAMRIGFRDIQDSTWTRKLEAQLEQELARGIKMSPYNQALSPYDGYYYCVKYCGYVCPECLSIGVVIDENVAQLCNQGDHFCDSDTTYNPIHLDSNDRQRIVETLRCRELPILLFTVVKALCQGNHFKLVAWDTDISFPPFATRIADCDCRCYSDALKHGSTSINENELYQFLESAKSTYGHAQVKNFGYIGSTSVFEYMRSVNICVAIRIV